MSEPRCKTCKYFQPHPLSADKGYGECLDDSKLIYSCYGIQSETDRPDVNENNTCSNHELSKFERVS